jgi:transposase InsO family protein
MGEIRRVWDANLQVYGGVNTSVGSHGDSHDDALAEPINGLYKAEFIHQRDPGESRQSLELATLAWVAWSKQNRLMEWLGHITPDEAEAGYYCPIERLIPEAA